MSKIDELIEKLCPNGVEFKKTKEIKKESFWLMPATPHYISEGIPYITSKNIRDGKINFEDSNYISNEDYLNISTSRKIEQNDLLVTMIGTIGETAFVEENTEFYGQNMYLIRLDETIINRKFYNYYLTSPKIKRSLISKKNTSSQGYIKAASLEELVVPVPPLEVQREIVHILDDFTLLSAELSAELKARQKQYEYYKEKLLTFSKKSENIQWVTLGEYCKRLKGTAITAGKMKEIANDKGNVKIFAGGKTMINTDESNIPAEDIINVPNIIVQSRGIIDFIYYEKLCSYKREMWSYTLENKITLKYIYYYLKNNVEYFRQRGNQMGSMPQISLDITEKYKLPIPAKKEQERIVNILDRFDRLCNDISEGLPAEIEARQKQYEYYRDKLLSFNEVKNNG